MFLFYSACPTAFNLRSLLIVILLNPLALGATHKVIKLSLVTQPL